MWGQRRDRACAGSAQPARLWQPDGRVDAQPAQLWHRWCRRAPASAIRTPRPNCSIEASLRLTGK
eukprot:scaffold16334_cov97-Phaeocystis_antarctica.AAC.3